MLVRLSEIPNWNHFNRVAVDIETYDPELTTLGPGVRRTGYITGISFCLGTSDGPAFYLPIRHAGGGNYPDPDNVLEYLRHQAKNFGGEICGANLQYDLDFLASAGVKFTPSYFRDIQISGPLLDEPKLTRQFDKTTGRAFWAPEFHRMGLDAQAVRAGLPGKDEDGLRAWATTHGLNPKKDMWQAPAGVVAPYAIQDVRLPLAILDRHEPELDRQEMRQAYDLECRLLPVLLKMRRRGVKIDLSKLERVNSTAWNAEVLATREISRLSGVSIDTSDLNTSAALARCLEAVGIQVPLTDRKVSAKTGKETGGQPSVTTPWLETVGHPIAAQIISAKKWNKIRTTFVASLQRHEVNGRIHCTFNQLRQEREDGETMGAEFGRLSSSDPNLQQQPVRHEEIGPLWRSIYVPDDGGQWTCIDFSSQEPRLITHFANITNCDGGPEAAESCRTLPDWDNHSMMAELVYPEFKRSMLTDPDKKEWAKATRGNCKTIFLGRCYGMGGGKLCRSLGLPTIEVVRNPMVNHWEVHETSSPEGKALLAAGQYPFEMAGAEGQDIIDRFNARVPYLRQLTDKAKNQVIRNGYIRTLGGRRCRFPVNPSTGKPEYLHKALNVLIQGSAAYQTKLAMVLADAEGVRLQLQVHDELDLTTWHPDEAKRLAHIMETCVELSVPSRCDIETGADWGSIK